MGLLALPYLCICAVSAGISEFLSAYVRLDSIASRAADLSVDDVTLTRVIKSRNICPCGLKQT